MNEETLKAFVEQVVVMALATMNNPAQTVTQAVTTVAKTGQRRIAADVRQKVKALRAQNGGPLHSHDPTWKLIDDGIVDAQGNLIADVKAPSAGTTVTATKAKLSAGDIKRMNRAELAQHISRRDLIALL